MQTIYNWLLYNTGNEGNCYTILNSQRINTPEGIDSLNVMGRLADFTIKNLLIHAARVEQEAPGSEQPERLTFSNERQVINYLTTGQTGDSRVPSDEETLLVFVREPTGASGDIIFPAEQS